MANPFLKYVGGKRQLLDQLVPRVPEQFGAYLEPFLGGGALFFALQEAGKIKKAVVSDLNETLMRVYAAVKADAPDVVDQLRHYDIPEANTPEFYYQIRDLDSGEVSVFDDAMIASRFIYLNRTCFNGLYRVNKSGRFNVPFGKYTNPRICDEAGILAAGAALQCAELYTESYARILERAHRGDFVYFDPPYAPLTETADFVSFTRDGFDDVDHAVLAEVFTELADRGVRVMLSNSDTPMTRKLFKGWNVETVLARRNINSNGEKRGHVNEILVRSY